MILAQPELHAAELGIRILIAGGLGALVGLDRELADQPAGLRTHVLVSLGAALFTLTGAYGIAGFGTDPDRPIDPTRVAAQVVTGIGFLGAGAIIRQGFSIRGLTTAAGLWVTAAIGTAVGLGYYAGAVITTIAAVVSLYFLKRVERILLGRLKPGRYQFVVDAGAGVNISTITTMLDQKRCRIDSVQMDTTDEGRRHIVVNLRMPPRSQPFQVAEGLEAIEGVINVDWSR